MFFGQAMDASGKFNLFHFSDKLITIQNTMGIRKQNSDDHCSVLNLILTDNVQMKIPQHNILDSLECKIPNLKAVLLHFEMEIRY